MRRWVSAAVGAIAMFTAADGRAQDDGYWKRAFAAVAEAQRPKVVVDRWTRGDAYWTRIIGPHSYREVGPFVVDQRLDDPKKAFAACSLYGRKPVLDHLSPACEYFLYPSTRDLPQAAEARAIYERDFAGTTGPVERIMRALKSRSGVRYELQAGATPEVLNTIVTHGYGDRTAWTIGEIYAYNNKRDPDVVQWLYDRGARLCEKDAGPPEKRFSCLAFYDPPEVFDATTIAGVLERNGFRPRTAAELDAAGHLWPWKYRPEEQRNIDFYMALLDPAARSRIMRAKIAERAALQKAADDQRTATARVAGLLPATPAENLAAARRLSEPGTSVCRPLTRDYLTYRFMATVEGASKTRLQLRAGAIRSENTEVTNVPYRDTRISPGVVFWDDAGLWSAC